MRVIFDVVTGQGNDGKRLGHVLQLPLGFDCFEAGMEQTSKTREDFEAYEEVARKVQIDE